MTGGLLDGNQIAHGEHPSPYACTMHTPPGGARGWAELSMVGSGPLQIRWCPGTPPPVACPQRRPSCGTWRLNASGRAVRCPRTRRLRGPGQAPMWPACFFVTIIANVYLCLKDLLSPTVSLLPKARVCRLTRPFCSGKR